MPYVASDHTKKYDSEALRARIPGWGVDSDPADRPSHPRERLDPEATGAHWEFPPLQEPRAGRERSIEHEMLTPVLEVLGDGYGYEELRLVRLWMAQTARAEGGSRGSAVQASQPLP